MEDHSFSLLFCKYFIYCEIVPCLNIVIIIINNNNNNNNKEKPARKRLNYGSSSASGPTVLIPIESYIAHQKLEIQNQEAKIESLEKELAEYVARRTLPSTSSLPCCNKCHRKEGHNRLNCPYPTACMSALFCGNIDTSRIRLSAHETIA